MKSVCISAEISLHWWCDRKPITSSPIREPRNCKTLLERGDSGMRIIVDDLSNDRTIAGKRGEASCQAMNMHFYTDETWGRIGSNKCHAKVHLVVLSGIRPAEIIWHGSRSAFWSYELY